MFNFKKNFIWVACIFFSSQAMDRSSVFRQVAPFGSFSCFPVGKAEEKGSLAISKLLNNAKVVAEKRSGQTDRYPFLSQLWLDTEKDGGQSLLIKAVRFTSAYWKATPLLKGVQGRPAVLHDYVWDKLEEKVAFQGGRSDFITKETIQELICCYYNSQKILPLTPKHLVLPDGFLSCVDANLAGYGRIFVNDDEELCCSALESTPSDCGQTFSSGYEKHVDQTDSSPVSPSVVFSTRVTTLEKGLSCGQSSSSSAFLSKSLIVEQPCFGKESADNLVPVSLVVGAASFSRSGKSAFTPVSCGVQNLSCGSSSLLSTECVVFTPPRPPSINPFNQRSSSCFSEKSSEGTRPPLFKKPRTDFFCSESNSEEESEDDQSVKDKDEKFIAKSPSEELFYAFACQVATDKKCTVLKEALDDSGKWDTIQAGYKIVQNILDYLPEPVDEDSFDASMRKLFEKYASKGEWKNFTDAEILKKDLFFFGVIGLEKGKKLPVVNGVKRKQTKGVEGRRKREWEMFLGAAKDEGHSSLYAAASVKEEKKILINLYSTLSSIIRMAMDSSRPHGVRIEPRRRTAAYIGARSFFDELAKKNLLKDIDVQRCIQERFSEELRLEGGQTIHPFDYQKEWKHFQLTPLFGGEKYLEKAFKTHRSLIESGFKITFDYMVEGNVRDRKIIKDIYTDLHRSFGEIVQSNAWEQFEDKVLLKGFIKKCVVALSAPE